IIANDGRRFQVLWNQADSEAIAYSPTFGMGGAIADPLGAAQTRANSTVTVGAEPRFIFAPNCAARPPVRMTVVNGGANRLQVTVTAGTSAAVPNNRLDRLQFGSGDNSA